MDLAALARTYSRRGRVSIDPFLAPGQTERLYEALRARGDWRQVINSGDKLFEFDRPTQQSLTEDKRRALDEAVYAGARRGFQYRYETVRIPDEREQREASDDLLWRFALWLSSGEALALLREVTDDARITFADAQATAYSPGDFLTSHDDDVAGKGRSAAYVLGLNPEWRIEWGGLFLMHGDNEGKGSAEALVPRFNRLNLFRVPQMHSVSEVTRATPYRRYSITGWLRR